MTATDLVEFMQEQDIYPASYTVADREYSLPSRSFLNDVFAEDFRAYLQGWGLLRYEAERNDCDNFALNAMTFAANLHARTSRRSTGIAFGWFSYRQERTGGGHAINFAIVDEKELRLVFFEPQRVVTGGRLEVTLTPREVGSCFGYALFG